MIYLYNRRYSSSLTDVNLKLKCWVVGGKKIWRNLSGFSLKTCVLFDKLLSHRPHCIKFVFCEWFKYSFLASWVFASAFNYRTTFALLLLDYGMPTSETVLHFLILNSI